MTTLREQLQDPIYKKWFQTPPKKQPDICKAPPWVVYVQRTDGGGWAKAEFDTYVEGYRFVAKNLSKYHDMSLTHKRVAFQPPVVREGKRRRTHLPHHEPREHWCPYCRRMTDFRFFRKHHAMPKWGARSDVRRCTICGVELNYALREMARMVKLRRLQNEKK